jgi:streptogramin lyase
MRPTLLVLCLAAAGCGGSEDRARTAAAPVKVVSAPGTADPIGERVQARIPIGISDVCSTVAAGGSVWVAGLEKPWIVRVDPERNRVISRVRVPGRPCQLEEHDGLLWALISEAEQLLAIDPVTERVVRRVRTEHTCQVSVGFAFGDGALWLVEDEGLYKVSKRDPRTGATITDVPPLSDPTIEGGSTGPCALAVAAGSLWVGTPNKVLRVDTRSGRVLDSIDAGFTPWFLVVGLGDEVWVGNFHFGEMRRLDARSGRVAAIYKFGGYGITADENDLWATSSVLESDAERGGRDPILVRLDRRRDHVTGRYRVGRRAPPGVKQEEAGIVLGFPQLAYGSLWVAHNIERRLYRLDPR